MKLKLVLGLAAGLAILGGAAAALAQMNPEMHQQMREQMMQMRSQMQHGPGMHHGSGHGPAHGPGHGQGHGQHGGNQPKGDSSPSSLAFHGVNQKMHEGMDIAFTGDADADFVRGMIPHHQGAVDMAKVVLAFGKDPQIRKLAEEIVKAQEGEIALMQEWLKKNTK